MTLYENLKPTSTIIYISHILDDIFSIGDYATVLRDGEIVGTRSVPQTERSGIRMMIGKWFKANICLLRQTDTPLLR